VRTWPITTTLVKFDQQSASNRGSSKASLYAVKQLRKIQLEENAAAG